MKAYYRVDMDSHAKISKELAVLVARDVINSTLNQTPRTNLEGLREAHRIWRRDEVLEMRAGGSRERQGVYIE